jgi:hypothetical protein
VTARSSYKRMMAAAGGEIPLETFRAKHVRVGGEPRAVERFQELMTRVIRDGFSAPTVS